MISHEKGFKFHAQTQTSAYFLLVSVIKVPNAPNFSINLKFSKGAESNILNIIYLQ